MKKKIPQFIIVSTAFLGAVFPVSGVFATHSNFDLVNLEERVTDIAKAYFNVSIESAWEFINSSSTTLTPVIVGILDSGTDTSHPEFSEDIIGENTPESAKTDRDSDGHGTQVAGIIGANNISFPNSADYELSQMNGILSGAHNLDYTLEIRKKAPLASIFKTRSKINDMIESGSIVINLSQTKAVKELGGFTFTGIFSRTFNESPDVLFVVAAGNEGHNAGLDTPANLGGRPNVLTVGATNISNDGRFIGPESSSNFGDVVGISAPGDEVYAPKPFSPPLPVGSDDYDTNFTDTSASAPFVTGVAGLIKAIQPGFTPERIKSVLTNSADPIKTGEPQKTMGNACHSNPDIISQQKTGATACRLNALSAVKTVTPFYNYKMDFVSVDGNILSTSGCNTNRQGQPVSFFDDFDDGSTNTGCTALFSQFGTFGEEAGHLTLNSNDAVSSTGFRVHTATLQTPFQEGGGNSQIEVSFKPDTPFGASENGFSNYGLFLRENVPSNIPALSIQAGNIEGRTFLNAIQFPEVITSQAFLSLSDLDNLVLKIELNDTSNLATPLFSIDNGSTFIPFRNPDNTIFRVPAFRESSNASLQVFGSLFLPQTPAQTQSQLLLPQNLPYTPVIVE